MRLNAQDVKIAAAGRWPEIATSVGIPTECLTGEHGPCPKCKDGTDRWRVYDDFDQTGGCICNQCGKNLGDGFAMVQWFTGCDFPAAIKLVADFLGVKRTSNGKPHIVAEYDYLDEAGDLLFQVCRMDPKDFRQRRPDGNGGWEWRVKGTRIVPYRLPQLLAEPGRVVFVVEGERDVQSLERIGCLATCNSGGAGESDHDN